MRGPGKASQQASTKRSNRHKNKNADQFSRQRLEVGNELRSDEQESIYIKCSGGNVLEDLPMKQLRQISRAGRRQGKFC